MLKADVFHRRETTDTIISASNYNIIIGLVLCWGFFVNWLLVVNIDPLMLRKINIWLFLLAYFASCFYGVYLFNKSSEPIVSFIGYNFVVVPFGLVVNMVVARYNPELVIDAIKVTTLVTVTMMALGSAFPDFFKKIYGALTVALLAVLVIELFQIFILKIHQTWIDWAVAILFCGYIGYDWGKANQIPKTLDNAVDSAAMLYMDIINLFLRILRIMGSRK